MLVTLTIHSLYAHSACAGHLPTFDFSLPFSQKPPGRTLLCETNMVLCSNLQRCPLLSVSAKMEKRPFEAGKGTSFAAFIYIQEKGV